MKVQLFAYEQVKAFIKTRITSGAWKPGDAVPSETTLMAQFSTRRPPLTNARPGLQTHENFRTGPTAAREAWISQEGGADLASRTRMACADRRKSPRCKVMTLTVIGSSRLR